MIFYLRYDKRQDRIFGDKYFNRKEANNITKIVVDPCCGKIEMGGSAGNVTPVLYNNTLTVTDVLDSGTLDYIAYLTLKGLQYGDMGSGQTIVDTITDANSKYADQVILTLTPQGSNLYTVTTTFTSIYPQSDFELFVGVRPVIPQ
jgi:hypothetical protein